MKASLYDKNRDYDANLDKVLGYVRHLTTEKDDDFLILCAGDTGTGKSMLMMHALDKYMSDYKSVDYVGLTKGSFASGFKKVQDVPVGFKFLGNDEANISKRDALSKYNKDLLDLYYSCRGLNIFHWWNNPSVDIIDKPFIKDRVKGFILITTKDKNRPRVYYYFTKNALIKIFEKYKNLDIKTIKKVKGKYASYKGWFRDYQGSLREDYLAKKNPRMIEKVDDFVGKYGDKESDNLLGVKSLSDVTGYACNSIRNFVSNKTIPPEYYVQEAPGLPVKFKEECISFLLKRREEKRKVMAKGFKNVRMGIQKDL